MPLVREVSDFSTIARSSLYNFGLLLVLISGMSATSRGRHNAALMRREPADSLVVSQNCGVTMTFARPPARVVTLNQAATEIMLVLGLKDRLVGTAYLDDQMLPELAESYRQVPVLASKYPSREILYAARPDLLCRGLPRRIRPGRRRIAGGLEDPGRRYVSRTSRLRRQESTTWCDPRDDIRGAARRRPDLQRC